MAGGRDSAFSFALLALLLLAPVSSQHTTKTLPPFAAHAGEKFVYSYQSSAQISREIGADLTAEVVISVCSTDADGSAELTVNVTSAQLTWKTVDKGYLVEENPLGDHTNWFSIKRADDGSINKVFYPSNESSSLVAFKKKLAQLLSVDVSSSSWREEGLSVVLVLDSVTEGESVGMRTHKETTIDRANGAISVAAADEHVSTGKNGELGTVMSQMVMSHSSLTLLTHHLSSSPISHYRPDYLVQDDLIITSSMRQHHASMKDIDSLISCSIHDPECVKQLEHIIQFLSDDEIITILQQYMDEDSEDYSLSKALSLLTVVSTTSPSLSTTHTLTSLLLPYPPLSLPNEQLISKLLFYFTISLPVDEECVESAWLLVTDYQSASSALKTQALLALGAMARRVRPSNQELATRIVADLHHLLEEHTGYSAPHSLHKHRRSTIPTLPSSSLPHSSLHALLLDSLANAGADVSFPTLRHHMTLGDLSVKHAALRAMKSFDTDESAEALLSVAESSSTHHPSLVRRARSDYQTHSRRKRDLTDLPLDQPSGQENSRFRRGSTGSGGGDAMNVTMPTVGWNQQFGDSNISAELSRMVANSFTLDTTDQSSKYLFSFHDDMVMTSHLSLSGSGEESREFEMMKTQLCLEGTASYNTVNILTGLTPEITYEQYVLYRDQSSELVEGFEDAYNLILMSNSAYDEIPESLIAELDNLIDVHFDDVMDQLDDTISKLNAIPSDFFLKSIAWDIYFDILAVFSTIRDSATANREVILSAVNEALPSMTERLYQSLLVEGQPFTTHSFHVPYLPYAPHKALVNIADVFRSVMVAYGGLKDAIQTVIDLTSPIGPNHSWLSPSSSREIGDNITILTNDITKLINQLQPQIPDGPSDSDLNSLHDIVRVDLRNSLTAVVGVVDDVIAQSVELSALLEGSRQAFTAFTKLYDSAQSTVDAIFGQKFHPLFPRQRRSCDHVSGCGSYPTTSHQEYGEGVALVTGDGDQVVVAPLSGYYSLVSLPSYDSSSTIKLTPSEASFHSITFTLTHILPSVELTESLIFIRGGEPLGVFTPEPQQMSDGDEYYIHVEAHKTIGSDMFTVDPTRFLQPIHDPSVELQYSCNDLVTYIGQTVVDRRSLAPDTPQSVPYGSELVENVIPDHEFSRPVDHLLISQGTILSGASVEVLSSSTFLMVGPIPVQFDFRAVGSYELDYSLDFSLLSRRASVSLTPSLVSRAEGYVRTDGVLYASVTLEGSILEASLPLSLQQNFLEWPLTASSQMDLVLSPTSLSLTSQLAQTTGAGEFLTEEILQTDTLWYYSIPPLNRDEFYYQGSLVDESPPQFTTPPYSNAGCYVSQLALGDFSRPLLEVEFELSEPQGLSSTAYQVGSFSKGDDIIGKSKIAGNRIVIPHQLIPASPIHVTVVATNLNGQESLATCSLPSYYDHSPPLARITPIRSVSSHPSKISALFALFDEFGLDTPLEVAIGTVPGDYGNDVMDWVNFNLSAITTPPDDNEEALNLFSFKRVGRLLTGVIEVIPHLPTASECALECLASDACRSFDHSTLEANCVLHSDIEGPPSPSATVENIYHTPPLQATSNYWHYEKLGVGNSTVIEFGDLVLTHNTLYYVNMHLVNGLGFTYTASSSPFLVDVSPPSPGHLESVISDEVEGVTCDELGVSGLECLENTTRPNHRVIVDDAGSAVVFNGLTPLTDTMYTSTTNYITANWDGLTDLQSGVHVYRWWVGSELGSNDIIPPTDPHMHLIGGQGAWTNMGLATGLNLSDGTYYISVQAISRVEYGGPLVTTIHHSTPYILDTSPPQLNDVIINHYDASINTLEFSYNTSDDGSGLHSVSLSLGRTEYDTAILGWTGVGTSGNGMVMVDIPDGVDTWVKLRATNNAGLSAVAVAETAIRVDRSPPSLQSYGDGEDIADGDIDYQHRTNRLCVHGTGIIDLESGITEILWQAGTSQGASDTVPSTDVTDSLLSDGTHCMTGLALVENTTYYSTLYITNGAISPLTTTILTDGVLVDMSHPEGGIVRTGYGSSQVALFSSDITTVTALWEGFVDYESGITEYIVTITHKAPDSDIYEDIYSESVDGSVREITLTHFSFSSGDSVIVEVQAMNGAGRLMPSPATSSPYTIDLSPPHISSLVDGSEGGKDEDYQSQADQLTVSWTAQDDESLIQRVEIAIWEQFEGRQRLIYPNPFISGQSSVEIDPMLTTYTLQNLSLAHGAKYITVLKFTNGAGLVSEGRSSGVLVDLTPPQVTSVTVEGAVSLSHETGGLEVVVTGTDEVRVRWSAVDTESGIERVFVGVVDENNTLITPEMTSYPGYSSGGVVEGLNLEPGTEYRVFVVAINSALAESVRTYSVEFRVVTGDTPGQVYDGENPALIDVDYTDEASAVTIHFDGFWTSVCGGVSHYEWSIGTSWEEGEMESIMSFTERGIVSDAATSSGYAQVLLPGLSSYGAQPLFVTVRATTDCGDILQSTSNGFIIDPSPPSLEVIGTGENAIEHAQINHDQPALDHNITYQTNPSFSSLWQLSDDQSGRESGSVVRIGTYPGGSDVQNETETSDDSIRSILQGQEGVPHYITVTGANRARLSATATSRAVVLDTSPPTPGELTCEAYGFPPPLPLPPYSPPLTPTVLVCEWSGMEDAESGVVEYTVTITETTNIIYNATLQGTATGFQTPSLSLNQYSSLYVVTLEAVNGAGLRREIESEIILFGDSDKDEYSGLVTVAVNYVRVENVSRDPERVLGSDGYTCLLDSDVISIEFPAPLESQYVDSDSYEVGIGYSAGTDDHKNFVSFVPTLATTGAYSHTLTHVNTAPVGRRPLYVTVQARSTLNTREIFKLTSHPIYIKSTINEWDSWIVDGSNPNTDVEFQVSTTEINAYFGIGSHCPLMYAQWAVEDASGTIVQDYLEVDIPPHTGQEVNNEFALSTDQVELYNEESYRVLLQAIDHTGEIFILRSNGLTVTTDNLVPGIIQDGPIPYEDLNHQEPIDYLSAHWTEFGDGTPQQEIMYYEVAAGSNMGYPNTRSDIAPFTNVGLNKSHTFTGLALIPEDVLYSVTVRATAVSGAVVESTSNGITVGHKPGLYPGNITLAPYSSSTSQLSVYWELFHSNLPIRSYELAIGSVEFNSTYLQHMCVDYLSDFENTFEVLSFTNVGSDTSLFLSNLSLRHNTSYFVTIRAIDEANNCITVISSRMLVDLSEPISPPGGINLGPPESQIGLAESSSHVTYTQSGGDLRVWWSEFSDAESGIDYYESVLFEQIVCGSNQNLTPVPSYPDYVSTGMDRHFTFKDLRLVGDAVYVVAVRGANGAGLNVVAYSEPVMVDDSVALPGTVKDGLVWEEDVVFQSDLSVLSGVFSHAKLPPRYPGVVIDNDPCPNTTFHSLTHEDSLWNSLVPTTITGIESASLHYSEQQTNISSYGLQILTGYDGAGGVESGAYYFTEIDLSLGGLVSLDIQASLGTDAKDKELEEQTVTSVVFIDSSATDILADFEYELREFEYPDSPDLNAVGLQIHHSYAGMEQKVVIWSKSSEPLHTAVYVSHDIPTIDLSLPQKYTLDFEMDQRDVDLYCWVDLYIDDQLIATLQGIAALSNETRIILHAFNRNGFVPEILDEFDPPRVESVFVNVSLPSLRSQVCDSGQPFYSPSSPIVQFSVGVGTSPGLTDITGLELLDTPCRPCVPGPCSSYACNTTCTETDPYIITFTLPNLTLSPGYHTNQSDASSGSFEFESENTPNTLVALFSDYFQPSTYFVTVEAITASGQHITASSNGVTIDITPPELLSPIDRFDVTFSTVQPTDFQASNDTISVRWAFGDLESGIVEYRWAIGTSPYQTDIQPFVSVGTAMEASNSDLAGILTHNTTYYVTVTATNGAGLNTTLTSNGVTYSSSVLNLTALEEVVEIEFVRSVVVSGEAGEEGEGEVVLVVEQGDRAAITWAGVSDDVEDIFWYIGTEPELGDILPKTEVSFNDSSRAEIQGGTLYLNGASFANVSEIIAAHYGELASIFFEFEPGRLVYNTLELCNFVHRCVAVETHPSILIRLTDVDILMESEGGDVEIMLTQTQGQSSEVTDGGHTVSLATTGGIQAGTVLVAGFLNDADLHRNYLSTLPYISNPYSTMTQTSDQIARRFAEVTGPSFFVSFLGQETLNGPLQINATFDSSISRDRYTLDIFYWDKYDQVWRGVDYTCGVASIVDWNTHTISSEVCSTIVLDEVASGIERQRRQLETSGSAYSGSGGGGDVVQDYLTGPVQFIVVGIGNISANTPPELLLPTQPLSLTEDMTLADFQLHYTDGEGDEVEFYIISPPTLGTTSLTLDGLLTYTPCSNCTGVDSFEVFIVEKPFGFNNVPLSASGVLVVEIENLNDNPFLFAIDHLSESGTDVTVEAELNVYIEANRTSAVSVAQVVAYDVDGYLDALTILTQDGAYGEAYSEVWLDAVSVLESLPLMSLPDDSYLGYVAFKASNITYKPQQDYVGPDIVRVRARDSNFGLSRTLTINIEVIPSWCLNGGVCNGSLADPNCSDIQARSNDPRSYACGCVEGYSGRYCEVDDRPIQPVTTGDCPDGIPLMWCDGDPCTDAVCPSNDSAVCRPNYCGGCMAEWFVGDTQIQCTADDPVVCFKPTTAIECLLSGVTTCQCPQQPYPCPKDSVFVETRHSECCVTFECRCPESSCPRLMEGEKMVQPVPTHRGNRFAGRCCPNYTFQDINECESEEGNTCSDVCVNHDRGYSCDCLNGRTLSFNGENCGVCTFEGREYLYGDRVKIGCNWCICSSDYLGEERWHCSADRCQPSCTYSGTTYQIESSLDSLSISQVACLCEETDTYADWICKAES